MTPDTAIEHNCANDHSTTKNIAFSDDELEGLADHSLCEVVGTDINNVPYCLSDIWLDGTPCNEEACREAIWMLALYFKQRQYYREITIEILVAWKHSKDNVCALPDLLVHNEVIRAYSNDDRFTCNLAYKTTLIGQRNACEKDHCDWKPGTDPLKGMCIEELHEGKPEISITNRELCDISKESINALVAINSPPKIYKRDRGLCRLRTNDKGMLEIENVDIPILRDMLTDAARFIREKPKGTENAYPPKDVAENILTKDCLPFPWLDGIIAAPAIREDGSVLKNAGYDEQSHLYLQIDTDLQIPNIPDRPTKQDAQAAAKYIQDELMNDFPFVDQASKTNALAGLILPFLRPAIKGPTPMLIMDKPTMGTGASLWIELIGIAATGIETTMEDLPDSNTETEKRITARLLTGAAIVAWDNVDENIRQRVLSSLLTSTNFGSRLLGKSKELILPNRACYYATGNNITVGGDMSRRCYYSRIDAKMPDPHLRDESTFKHEDIKRWAKEHRGELIANILTLISAWFVAGEPKGKQRTLGSYKDWVRVIGGVLDYAGVDGLLDNQATMTANKDVEAGQLKDFITVWYELFDDRTQTSTEIARVLKTEGSSLNTTPPPGFEDMCNGGKSITPARVGRMLTKICGKRVRYEKGALLFEYVRDGDRSVYRTVYTELQQTRLNETAKPLP